MKPTTLPSTTDTSTSHRLDVPGGRLRYLDVGQGPAIVLVHGTPTSSYLYRHLIPALAERHRVIAPDHLGFGLSDKPRDADYTPEAHARNLEALIDHLGLDDVALVVHDFGGPMGLSWAVEHPERVRGLVLFNTWMWSLEGTAAARMSRLLSGRLGRFLYTRLNFSPRALVRAGWGDRTKLPPDVHRAYIDAFPTPHERYGLWALAKALVGSSAWYETLWQRRERIARKPALLVWGMADPAFGPEYLERWKATLTDSRLVELPGVGHFVPEEAPDEAAAHVAGFLEEVEGGGRRM